MTRSGRRLSTWWVAFYDRSRRREIRESSGSKDRRVALRLLAQREAEAAARPLPFADARRRPARAVDGTRRGARGRQAHGLTALRRAVATLGARAIDEQTAWGRALTQWRTMLIADLGGADTVTTAQSQVIEVAARTKLLLDSIDGWLFEQPRLVNGRTRTCYPVVIQRQRIADALVHHLETLGLERKTAKVKTLGAYLTERYESSPGHEPSPGRGPGETAGLAEETP